MPNLLGRRIPTSNILQTAPRPGTGSSLAPASPRVVGPSPMKDSGIGDVLSSLGKTFQNGLVNATRQEQLDGLSLTNDRTRKAVAGIGPNGEVLNPQDVSIGAALGILNPEKLARMTAHIGYQRDGAGSETGTRASYALGEGNRTQKHFDESFANELEKQRLQEATKLQVIGAQEAANTRRADMELKEVNGPNGPQFVRRSDAVGMKPVLSMDQQKSGFAEALTRPQQTELLLGRAPAIEPYNATTAGGTVPVRIGSNGDILGLNTGQKVEGVSTLGKLTATTADGLGSGDATLKNVLEGRISTEKAVNLIDTLTTELDKPNAGVSVGFLGSLSEVANNVRSQFEAGAKAIGGLSARDELRGSDPQAQEVRQTLDRVIIENQAAFKALQSQGIDTARIRALIEDLAYAQAKANDPSGRVSNQDVERAGRQVGMGLGDPVAMKAVLGDLRGRTLSGQDIRDLNSSQFLGAGKSVPSWATRPVSPGSPSAAAAATPAREETWVRGPDGKLVKEQQSALKRKYGLE